MDLTRALEHLEPQLRRRVNAAMMVCAFLSTEDIERIGKLSGEVRSSAIGAEAGNTVPISLLTPGERAVLDRALRVYAATYQELVGREKDPVQKQDLRNYITAADHVLKKLRQASGLPG